MQRYPEIWDRAGRELITALKSGRPQTLSEFAAAAKSAAEVWKKRIDKSGGNIKVIESALPHVVKSRMSLLALDRGYLAAAAGKVSGKVRFNLVNGYIIQKLLFSRHLTRKPASLRWFKFWWPFITQKRILMPLVQKKGIYCFYTADLIERLSALIGERFCLEIAAGDGTLTRFLKDRGVNAAATDDFSWSHAIEYPETVEKIDARHALAKYAPPAVICSWPPPENSFERHVFLTKSVELYVVIGSRHKFLSGDWEAYHKQKAYDWHIDRRLSAGVVPPELESAVLVFRRKPPESIQGPF